MACVVGHDSKACLESLQELHLRLLRKNFEVCSKCKHKYKKRKSLSVLSILSFKEKTLNILFLYSKFFKILKHTYIDTTQFLLLFFTCSTNHVQPNLNTKFTFVCKLIF